MAKATVNREEFLSRLLAIQPGLSPREILQQSSCVVFDKGWLISFNDEISCRYASKLGKDFVGAVKAKPLIDLLSKLPDDEVGMETTPSELIISGKGGRRSGVAMELEIQLQVATVEAPGEWKKLHEDFAEAIGIVGQCAGKDQSNFRMTCVHITPKHLEACDNYQLARYKIKSGFEQECLVRGDSIKSILQWGMTEFSETETWMHFRNDKKLIFSCRRFLEEYPDLTTIMEIEGAHPATLPKGLAESADIASIFSSEAVDSDTITVKLRKGSLWIRGQGISGWFEQPCKMKYDGEPVSFLITPKLLIDIVKKHTDVLVSNERLKVDGGKWTYLAYLGATEANGQATVEADEPIEAAAEDE
jgi:DNA polymerase III sliding clamp (beta) subunit (PCNA family)